jgi:hypothetical protein
MRRNKATLAGSVLSLAVTLALVGQRTAVTASNDQAGSGSSGIGREALRTGSARTIIAATQECDTTDAEKQPWETLDRFFAAIQSRSTGEIKASVAKKPKHGESPDPPPPSIRTDPKYLIATVPDPQTTNLALAFDRALESIVWAVGDTGYTLEQYWIPWKAGQEAELSSLADRKCHERELRKTHDDPGVLIFRKLTSKPEFLVIFVIGESPSAGINLAALDRVLGQIQGVVSDVKIVGPTFSGSLEPLGSYLSAFRPTSGAAHLSFRLISGTVTSHTAISLFRETVKNPNVSIQFVVENDDRAGRAVFSVRE